MSSMERPAGKCVYGPSTAMQVLSVPSPKTFLPNLALRVAQRPVQVSKMLRESASAEEVGEDVRCEGKTHVPTGRSG